MRRIWAWTWTSILVDSSAPGTGRNAAPQTGQCFAASLTSCTSATTGKAERSLRPCPGLPGCWPRLRGLVAWEAPALSGRSVLALGAIQALGQVADRGLQRFHVRLQGGFPLHQPLVWRLPVVCLPCELDVGLLCQHHCLLRKGHRASPLHWPKFGRRDRLWQGIFHGLGYSSFFWKVPLFLKGIWVNRIFTLAPVHRGETFTGGHVIY